MLRASFHQYLCYWLIFFVVLTSFIAWPSLESTLLMLSFYGLILGVVLVFIGQLRRLKNWHCQIVLDGVSGGRLDTEALFRFGKPAFICPLFCMLYLEFDDQSRQICCVWADMLDDSQYRTLCRLAKQSC
ncbi:protein YgfX [Mucilaginibacter ginsenosidivorans]|uniref:protein YgfX n=1 Tax=Shewanella aestuarii TaxID=1028752 RepID=UPI003D15CB52